jgi:hypothetical protein
MNIFLQLFLITFFTYLILYIFNYNLSKKYYEYYGKTESGLLCGEKNDVCRIDEEGDSSCCTGYTCTRNKGNFHNKVCKSDDEINFDFNSNFGYSLPKITYPVIKMPSINTPNLDGSNIPTLDGSNIPTLDGSRIPNVDFPNINLNNDIPNINLPSTSFNFLNFDFLNFNNWDKSLTCNTIK